MKKFILFLLIGLPAFAGEENKQPTALQVAPVEKVSTTVVSTAAAAVSPNATPVVATEISTEKKTLVASKKVKVTLSSEVKSVKKAVEPRGWHPKLKIGFTLIALGVVLAVIGLGFVGGLSAFIGLLFTIAGLLHTY
jgi:hypothetical protein